MPGRPSPSAPRPCAGWSATTASKASASCALIRCGAMCRPTTRGMPGTTSCAALAEVGPLVAAGKDAAEPRTGAWPAREGCRKTLVPGRARSWGSALVPEGGGWWWCCSSWMGPSSGLCLTALPCTPTGHGRESRRNATLWDILNACSGRPFPAFSSDDPGRIYAFRGKQAGRGGGGKQGKCCVLQRAAQRTPSQGV